MNLNKIIFKLILLAAIIAVFKIFHVTSKQFCALEMLLLNISHTHLRLWLKTNDSIKSSRKLYNRKHKNYLTKLHLKP